MDCCELVLIVFFFVHLILQVFLCSLGFCDGFWVVFCCVSNIVLLMWVWKVFVCFEGGGRQFVGLISILI